MTKYIGRYLGRPVIATSRIDSYDGDLLDMDYFLNEDELDNDFEEEGFYIFS